MASKKRGLGKGLAALIPDNVIDDTVNEKQSGEIVTSVDISLIEPNKEQPRREFNSQAINELADSIKKHGVIQPIIVRRVNNGYELVTGERRWRASKEAGLKKVPCIIKDIEQIKSTEMALIENIQREDLNQIEEAIAYNDLMKKHGMTQEDVSKVVGKSRSYIANMVRLLNLDNRVIDLISRGEITGGHGKALLSIEEGIMQHEIAKEIVKKKLSVRETEKLVKKLKNSRNEKRKTHNKDYKDPVIIDIEDTLRKILGTKVIINNGKKKGKIEIEYYNNDDLQRLIELLINSNE